MEIKFGKSIPIDEILSKSNIRTDIEKEDLNDLMQSIKQHGLLEPIGVFKEDGRYVVAYGHRRLHALKKLGFEKLEFGKELIEVEPETDEEQLILNTIENVVRKDITPVELGRLVFILKKKGLNNDEIATRLSIAKTKVEASYGIYQNAPEGFRDMIGFEGSRKPKTEGKISSSLASAILGHFSKKEAEILLKFAKENEISNHDVALIRTMGESGIPVEEALRFKDQYIYKTIAVPCRKDEIKKLEKTRYDYFNSLSNYIKAILVGQAPANNNLIWIRLKKSKGK